MSDTLTPGEALGFLAANPCECGQECKMKEEAIAVLRHALQGKVDLRLRLDLIRRIDWHDGAAVMEAVQQLAADVEREESPTKPSETVCYFCRENFADAGLDPDDFYCYGCHEYVCSRCERNSTLCGTHDVGEHALSRSWDDKHLDEEAE